MTKAEWLKCTDPQEMLVSFRITDRKLRLFAAACCRRIWNLLLEECSRNAVEVAERFADGLASDSERGAAECDAFFLHDYHAEIYESIRDDEELAEALNRMRRFTDPRAFSAAEAAANSVSSSVIDCGSYSARFALEAITNDPARNDERIVQCRLLRDIYVPGLPALSRSLPTWNDESIPRLAEAIYEDRCLPDGTLDSTRLTVLADVLEDAGCTDSATLDHLRGPGPHVRGCWVLDLLLGRE
jgi:hypothetical protein